MSYGVAQRNFGIRTISIVVGIAITVLAIKYGQLEQGYRILQKYPPDFTLIGWLKILATLGAAGWIFLAIRPAFDNTRGFFDDSPGTTLSMTLSITMALLLVCLIILAVFEPQSLLRITVEGTKSSTLTDIFLAATVVTAIFSARQARQIQQARIGIVPAVVPLLAIAAIAFVILMEEMSWGQHLLGFGTPELFEKNIQDETNLHNFYTYRFELAYYSSAFGLFMVLPWIWPKRPSRFFDQFSFYVPPSGIILISAPLSGLFFESWNTVPLQIILYLGIMILIHSAMDPSRGSQNHRYWCGFIAILLTSSQVIFMNYGHGFIKGHELSEFKELLIAVLMFIYSAWLFWKLKKQIKGN